MVGLVADCDVDCDDGLEVFVAKSFDSAFLLFLDDVLEECDVVDFTLIFLFLCTLLFLLLSLSLIDSDAFLLLPPFLSFLSCFE